MRILLARHINFSLRSVLLSASAVIALLAAGSSADACPLGSHDSPRVKMLHALQNRGLHGSEHHMSVAQLQSQPQAAQPKRTELGAYGRDLPKGAAAPSADAKPPNLIRIWARLSWIVTNDPAGYAQAYFDQGYRLGWGFNHARGRALLPGGAGPRPQLRHVPVGRSLGARPAYQLSDGCGRERPCFVRARESQDSPKAGDMQAALV